MLVLNFHTVRSGEYTSMIQSSLTLVACQMLIVDAGFTEVTAAVKGL